MTEDRIEILEEELGKSDAYGALIFGSYARGEDFKDIDVAVFTEGTAEELARELPAIFDVQKFSDLPLYVGHRALEEGEIVYLVDRDKLYDQVLSFIKEYEDFKPIYKDYLEGVKAVE